MDDWEEQSWFGRQPAREIVMIQCAGSRDRRRLPYCSRVCCMIALKHAIRLRALFPAMKVTICYLELRAAGVGYENWYLEARRAGVEFLRGTPPNVQFDERGRPVIEVEDVTGSGKRLLRPDLVVLSTGMVPATDAERIASVLNVDLDEDGFIEILDRKNRATETTAEGVFVCGSAAGPKALVEVNTEASAVASEIHNFLISAGRRMAASSAVDAATCVGCDTCVTMCPFGAIELVERPADAPRPADVKDEGKLAVIDEQACRACGICAANCPEMAIVHNLDDEALFGRLAIMTERSRTAGDRLLLQGVRRRRHQSERPAPRRLPRRPCASSSCPAWDASARCTSSRRRGSARPACSWPAAPRAAASTAAATCPPPTRSSWPGELLAEAGQSIPLELWHLCAVDRHTVGRRIRRFCAVAEGRRRTLGETAASTAVSRLRGKRGLSGR